MNLELVSSHGRCKRMVRIIERKILSIACCLQLAIFWSIKLNWNFTVGLFDNKGETSHHLKDILLRKIDRLIQSLENCCNLDKQRLLFYLCFLAFSRYLELCHHYMDHIRIYQKINYKISMETIHVKNGKSTRK